ncbi:hypothetical protein [Streptomyces griseoruber]|uniref:hypothetical protein n=1 Tax=Streptomyces griseoruber TaxID=1943 RepID=UPI0007C86138|nr:hypothetical protein [Streptomyces griseoruber]
METGITAALIIAVIVLGMVLIHRLNAQHDARIAAYRYSDALPGVGRRRAKNRRPARPSAPPAAASPEPPCADDVDVRVVGSSPARTPDARGSRRA